MATTKESQTCQQFSAWNPPDLDHMSRFQLERNYNLQGVSPATNVALQGSWTSNLRCSDLVQRNAVADSVKLPPHNGNTYTNDSQLALTQLLRQHGNSPCPNGFGNVKDCQFSLTHNLGVTDKPIGGSATTQKRFLIFDKSGSQTRLFCSPFTPENRIISTKIPSTADSQRENFATTVGRQILVKSTIEEKCDENDFADGEGEMAEDSDEINALLYSDSDDDYNDDDTADDEVTSTGHTFPLTIQEGYIKNKILDELNEEVASSDEPPKRQRLIDGRYKKSSFMSFDNSMKQASYEDDTESSCAGARNYSGDIDLSKRETKVKIRNSLKVIASMIPGSKDNDPISIIDNAIVYLKTMRTEAGSLGLSSPESDLTSFSQ